MDKMVEIARFSYPADAQTLISLLKSEGIDCYLRNELTTQMMAGYVDVGGARVEILEKDVERAFSVMKDNGFISPENETGDAEPIEKLSGLAQRIPLIRRLPLEKQLITMLFVIALALAGLIGLSKLLA